MKNKKGSKKPVRCISDSMLDFFARKQNPHIPFDLERINEQLDKIDPDGKKALKNAQRMMNE